jgi:AAA domain/Bifunctional DNA primase/polymerase, N-terminal
MILHTDDPFLVSPPLPPERLRNAVTARRVALLKLGYEPIPVLSGRKRPAMNGWQEARITIPPDEDVITPWADTYPGALSTGIRTRYTPGFDIDIKDQNVADQVEQALLNMVPSGTILKRVGQPPKRLIPFRCTTPFRKISATFKAADDVIHKIEVLADGQQFVAEGIHETTQRPYRWADNVCLLDVAHEHLPLVDEALARHFVAEAGEIMRGAGWVEVGAQGKPKGNGKPNGQANGHMAGETAAKTPGSSIYGRTALRAECDKLAAMPKDSGRNNALNTAAFNLFQLVAGGELDEERDQVRERLFAAAEACGLVAEYGGAVSVRATIESGAKAGRAQPRRAPNGAGGPRDRGGDETGDQRADQDDDELVIAAADELEMCGVDWLWPGRFARGKFGLVAGLPDMGKGQIAAFIAAAVTASIALPCDEGIAPQGNVIWFNAEDGERDTVLPRLIAAGADLKRVHFVNGARVGGENKTFSLVTDLRLLRKAIERIGNVVLVIIDPMSAYLGVGKVDGRSATDVRGVLTPLKDMAEEFHVAVIGIAHFNKKDDIKSALLRVSDSIAYVAAARHVYAVLDDPENKDSKLFVKAKNNLAPDKKALRYGMGVKTVGRDERLGVDIDAPFIVWHPQHVELTANEAMQAAAGQSGYAKREAREFLLERLRDGPVKAEDIYEEAEHGEGISRRTLERAKKEMGIKSRKAPGKFDGAWTWELPAEHRQYTPQ